MFRLWAKEVKDNRVIKDTTIENGSSDTRTHKVFQAVDEVCAAFDRGRPIWLDSNVSEFQRHAKTRFAQDHFIEDIAFDFLEIQVLEED